jgi:hypothetical protein
MSLAVISGWVELVQSVDWSRTTERTPPDHETSERRPYASQGATGSIYIYIYTYIYVLVVISGWTELVQSVDLSRTTERTPPDQETSERRPYASQGATGGNKKIMLWSTHQPRSLRIASIKLSFKDRTKSWPECSVKLSFCNILLGLQYIRTN